MNPGLGMFGLWFTAQHLPEPLLIFYCVLSDDGDDVLTRSFVLSADPRCELTACHNIDCVVGLSGTIRFGAADG